MIDEVHTFFVCNMLLKAFNVVIVEKKFEQGQNPKNPKVNDAADYLNVIWEICVLLYA